MALIAVKQIVCLILTVYLLIYLANVFYTSAGTNSATIVPSLLATRNRFDADILQAITANRTRQNVVISPVSIQICLAFALLGAGGETAKQMRLALRIPATMNKIDIARDYGLFLQRNFYSRQSVAKNAPVLRMVNRIYVDAAMPLVPQFNELAKKGFAAEAVPIEFTDKSAAVKSINKWVEEQTQGKVKDLVHTNDAVGDFAAIFVNAIYFKAKWEIPFSKTSTSKEEFKISDQRSVEVDMMYNGNGHFKYADLHGLDATALEMPYKDSDLSMLILLPNKVGGLLALERIMAKVDLRKILEKMERSLVDVSLPKFRIEFDVDLQQPLMKLGMRALFGKSPNFSALFVEPKPNLELRVKHKAILDVNEAGSEAAAASFVAVSFKSMELGKQFYVNHPFIYMIHSQEVVYFAGHVAQF